MPQPHAVPVVDLFAGPGGLGEGFSSFRQDKREACFKVRLSIEKDFWAHQTLTLRAFYRQFAPGRAPGIYYDLLRGSTERDTLFARFPDEAAQADSEAWRAELGVMGYPEVRNRIKAAVGKSDDWILIGGPPCQAYSIAGRSRNKGVEGYRPDRDRRQYLYAEYLEIIADHWPAIFVMENVKGLLSAKLRNHSVFDFIHEDLSAPARALHRRASNGRAHRYTIFSVAPNGGLFEDVGVHDFVVQAERHGVPQARHRVILLGVRDDLTSGSFSWRRLLPTLNEIPVQCVLDGMPALRSGLSGGNDSSDAWLRVLRDARDRRWLKSAGIFGGSEVRDLVAETIQNVSAPRHDRGAEFIAGDFRVGYRPDWFIDGKVDGLCNHSTREHMPHDLHRYLYAACFAQCHGRSPVLSDFPADLLPDHDNVHLALSGHGYFADRFRVQVRGRCATTITSHLAKDGHGFIHPDPRQCRSLTVREAARLQTFPDNYLFCGSRTQQYVQVGNAVPPLLAESVAGIVWALLETNGLAG
jgi:DNA (cytosine-5)-methyltransferase 1